MAGKSNHLNKRSGLPPAWAESLLEGMLPRSDGRIVSGDLREEYVDAILPQFGRARADCWYLHQVLSFVPRSVSRLSSIGKVLLMFSPFTTACGGWLALMEWLLRHPGHSLRIGIDLLIALIPLVTIVVLLLHLGARTERWLWAAAVALIALAGQAIIHDARSIHFEGFVLLISSALVLQGVLMLISLGRGTIGSSGRVA
jgi:hypothetical protein